MSDKYGPTQMDTSKGVQMQSSHLSQVAHDIRAAYAQQNHLAMRRQFPLAGSLSSSTR